MNCWNFLKLYPPQRSWKTASVMVQKGKRYMDNQQPSSCAEMLEKVQRLENTV
ncbi:hypothetical protein [Aquibacillus albus]|uniref:Uncharacterized protein n=1 Tax=Aquibacillus albus TaxID=1168171 RepID=A0ABS2MWH0_9BACI|nr:hypothetical protein [Aquibacillus albus]MBM7570238.1 hypothetical protein [Aquibacillus albus]